jgi:hypothetical protein
LRFRVPIRDLFANLLINRVRAGGVEFELVPVVEALQASVEERREEVGRRKSQPSANARPTSFSEMRLHSAGSRPSRSVSPRRTACRPMSIESDPSRMPHS